MPEWAFCFWNTLQTVEEKVWFVSCPLQLHWDNQSRSLHALIFKKRVTSIQICFGCWGWVGGEEYNRFYVSVYLSYCLSYASWEYREKLKLLRPDKAGEVEAEVTEVSLVQKCHYCCMFSLFCLQCHWSPL